MTACSNCGGVAYRIRVVHGDDRAHLERECVGCGTKLDDVTPAAIADEPEGEQ